MHSYDPTRVAGDYDYRTALHLASWGPRVLAIGGQSLERVVVGRWLYSERGPRAAVLVQSSGGSSGAVSLHNGPARDGARHQDASKALGPSAFCSGPTAVWKLRPTCCERRRPAAGGGAAGPGKRQRLTSFSRGIKSQLHPSACFANGTGVREVQSFFFALQVREGRPDSLVVLPHFALLVTRLPLPW